MEFSLPGKFFMDNFPGRLLLTLLFSSLLYSAGISAETDDYPVIYAIKIVGNHVTNEALIKREMKLVPGEAADPELLEIDRNHLLSLGVFNQVELSFVTDLGRAVVLVRVTERFYIYPYPIFQYDPKRPERRVLGLSISHYNFRGNAERLTCAWWDGYERGIYLLHRDPWFSIGGRYGIRTQILFNDSEIISPEGVPYRAITESYLVRARRRLDSYRWLGIEIEWQERASKGQFYTISGSGRDRILNTSLLYEAEKRDYVYYARSGYYFTTTLTASRMIDTTHSYYSEFADFRIYKSLGRVTLALRLSGETTHQQIPWYRQPELSVLDIRSKAPLELKASGFVATNLELRFNIVPVRYFSFPEIPLAGRYLQKMRFSVEGLLFVDRSYLEYRGHQKNAGFTACGCGLQFQLPYVEVGHAVIGWDPGTRSRPIFVVGTGVTF